MTNPPFEFTNDQTRAMVLIKEFMTSEVPAFILTGYAGTGKTTLLRLVAEQLKASGKEVKLLAPTGRAAKILKQKTGLTTSTIHSGIYNFDDLNEVKVADENEADSFKYYFDLKTNGKFTNQVIIVDEASMLSNTFSEGEFFRFGSGYLLNDLIDFSTIQHPASDNKIIFVGDPAQLEPPDGGKISPALSEVYLKEKFDMVTMSATLTQVVRQGEKNTILAAAVRIRKGITSGYFNAFDLAADQENVVNVQRESFFEAYNNAPGKKIIITYTNKVAHGLNLDIRKNKFNDDLWLRQGDVMLVGQNNHLTGLFNGEFGFVNRVLGDIEVHQVSFKKKGGATGTVDLKWQKIELAFLNDANERSSRESYMLVNYLYGDSDLDGDTQQALYVDFKNRNPHLKAKTELFKDAIRNDPFFNALRLKYGYAITCHKAQGGEWDSAFVFWDYGRQSNTDIWVEQKETRGRTNASFFRWAYTAITRASNKLYCIHPPQFTPYSNMTYIQPEAMKGLNHLAGLPDVLESFVPDHFIHEALTRLGLDDQPAFIQQHAMSVLYQCRKAGIELVNWQKRGYEVLYYFYKGEEKACIKGWVNEKETFSPTYQNNPSGTNAPALLAAVKEICEGYQKYQAVSSHANTTTAHHEFIAFDSETAEQKPFLEFLFLDLQALLKEKSIVISQVDHLAFRDRYTFIHGTTKAIIDFEYNGDGFFGRVLPILNPPPGPAILEAISSIVEQLKHRV